MVESRGSRDDSTMEFPFVHQRKRKPFRIDDRRMFVTRGNLLPFIQEKREEKKRKKKISLWLESRRTKGTREMERWVD